MCVIGQGMKEKEEKGDESRDKRGHQNQAVTKRENKVKDTF